MKTINRSLAAAVFLAGTAGAGWAQNQTGIPHGASKKAPLAAASSAQGSNMHALNNEIRHRLRQIHKDLKSGKLTPDQAKAQMEKLKMARKQELVFFRQNGQKEITADQKSQLDQMLN